MCRSATIWLLGSPRKRLGSGLSRFKSWLRRFKMSQYTKKKYFLLILSLFIIFLTVYLLAPENEKREGIRLNSNYRLQTYTVGINERTYSTTNPANPDYTGSVYRHFDKVESARDRLVVDDRDRPKFK